MNKGVREAIRYLEHAIDHAEDTSADTAEMNIYGAFWTDMANAAARCASDLEHKKIAPGAANTESEKQNSSKFSVAEKAGVVKAPQAAAQELADTLLRLIGSMRKAHIDEHSIVETLVLALRPGKNGDPEC